MISWGKTSCTKPYTKLNKNKSIFGDASNRLSGTLCEITSLKTECGEMFD